ncbi:glycosyltransferase family 4 protein [Salinibacter ruber]|uniref:glycosyltransferase family 4 protein n=1 Tax=Salinibacter ruber TaxID=146919 RepID=UPI000E5895ED|nr:glycosyltransferase family 4 protein [Salinibacter ruber]
MDDINGLTFAAPHPPPIGGYTRIAENFASAWAEQTGHSPVIIDTSPGRDKHEPGVGVRDVIRGLHIGAQMWWKVTPPRAFIVLATALFYQKLRPVIDYLHRTRGLPTFVWFSGGVVHEAFQDVSVKKRKKLVASLNAVDRVIVETKQVRNGLQEEGVDDIITMPNPRLVDWDNLPDISRSPDRQEIRVLFFSRVVAEKGPFVLAEAVQKARSRGANVTYDIYGPVAESDCASLQNHTDDDSIRYRGVFDGDTIEFIKDYDIVGLPTWFKGEGHPGVIVEAMMAGVPVLTTNHKAIPELVDDGENGLLVETNNVEQLTEALCCLAENRQRIGKMGRAHRERLHQHDAAEAVRRVREEIEQIQNR